MRRHLIAVAFNAMQLLSAASTAADFDIAHVREQGQDMIVIPLDPQIEFKSDQARGEIAYSLQTCASAAGLDGTVVLVWPSDRSMMFIAPREWRGFFESIDMLWVAKNINKTLHCR